MNDGDTDSILSIDSVTVDKDKTEDKEEETESSYIDVFKNKDFVKLLTGQFFSNFGDAIFRVSIIYFVYHIADATSMTLVLASQTLPWILIGPIAGVFADRVSRKAIMIGADIIRGLTILFLPLLQLILTEDGILIGIVIISFILGAASATFVAPRSAAIPEITGLKLYVKAISVSQLVFQTLAVIGPLIAAPIYLILDTQTFWITSACYFASATVILFTVIPSASRDKDDKMGLGTVLKDLKNGLAFLIKHPTVRLLLFLFSFLILGTSFAGPLLLPYLFEIKHNAVAIQYFNVPRLISEIKNPTYIAVHYYGFASPNYIPTIKDILKQLADSQYAYIGASTALGAIAGNLIFGKFESKIGRPRGLLLGSIAISSYYFIFFFKPGLIVLLIAGLVMGFFNGMMSLSINALFAENVPNAVRGRAYSATNAYLQVLTVTCLSISGLTADSIGIVITITGSGIFLLSTTIGIIIWTKAYRFAGDKPNPNLVKFE